MQTLAAVSALGQAIKAVTNARTEEDLVYAESNARRARADGIKLRRQRADRCAIGRRDPLTWVFDPSCQGEGSVLSLRWSTSVTS